MRSVSSRWFSRLFVVLAFVLLFVPGQAAAQVGKITGVVTNAATGEPLAGVQVLLEGTGVGTLTAENGRYFIINVRPGMYTVVAQLIGYQTVRRGNVLVTIDVTRTVNFELTPQAVAVEEIRVEAERAVLVDLTSTGTADIIQAQELANIPIKDIQGALALRQGFLVVPDNTDILTVAELKSAITPVRIRGGRGGETQTLIDWIPVNNFVFGGPAFDITNKAFQQIDFIRGGYEPQYGNALSGIINIATREGGTELEGAVEYQTSEIGGALGSDADDLLGFELFEGFLAGAVPGTNEKLRFNVAGRQQNGAQRVLEFDDEIFDYQNPEFGFGAPNELDLFTGWRAFGYDTERDIFGKLTLFVTPTAKLNFTAIDYERQRLPFDWEFLLTYDDPLSAPTVDTPEDSAAILGNRFNNRLFPTDFKDIVIASSRLNRNLYVANWDHTLGGLFYKLSVGRFDQRRVTCNYFEGVCLEGRFEDPNFTDERFIGPVPGGRRFPPTHPTTGTDDFFGGEDLKTTVARGDVQWQATDHQNLQGGIYFQRHDLKFDETLNIGGAGGILLARLHKFGIKPNELAFYLQDRIEYDFLTVKLGFRVDRTDAPGRFFADPLDPTNGTTAHHVCLGIDREGNPTTIWDRPVTLTLPVKDEDPASPTFGQIVFREQTFQRDPAWSALGINCGGDKSVLPIAARIAYQDDFVEAEPRWQFSPRVHINFPVTASASMFFNFGRYSQNPLLNNLYRFTGVGTAHEAQPLGFFLEAGGKAEDYFGPKVFDPEWGGDSEKFGFIGNTHLDIEKTTLYEIGFTTTIGEDYGLSVVLFSKDQTGLTGVLSGGQRPDGSRVFDPGATYGTASPSYPILVNQDFTTVRGFEINFRRRLSNYWAFDLNYGFSQARTNASDPQRETTNIFAQGDPRNLREVPSEVDIPHAFNGTLRFQVGAEPPDMPLGDLLKFSSLSFVVRAASGFPYTPSTTFTGTGTLGNLDRNSGRSPATFQVDLWGSKDWRVANLQYGVFLRVVNLFDRKNCIQVFTSTGTCEGGSPDQSRAREGNTFSGLGDITSTFLDRPQYQGPRRSINAGFRVSF